MNSCFCFHEQDSELAFLNRGWLTVPLLSDSEAEDMISIFNNFHRKKNDIHAFTLCSPNYEMKKEIFMILKEYFTPKLNLVFSSYRLTGGNFYFKASHSSFNIVPPHQDWTFVDEKANFSINVWIPLVDMNKLNGAYHIIEGSHRWEFTYRGSNIPSACSNMQFSFDNLKYLPAKKGEAIIYDHRLVHATPPNISDVDRIAIVLNLIPYNTDLIHCIIPDRDSNSIDIYKVDEEFFWKFTFSFRQNVMPSGYQRIKSELYDVPKYVMSGSVNQ